jgi:transcription elongation factor GreA
MERVPMTAGGFRRLEIELKTLKTEERPAVIKAIAEAREHGDLSENAEYHAARERQSFIEGRVRDIEDKISRSEVIDVSKLSGDTVKFGAQVSLVDEDTEVETAYQIVGVDEADISQGLLSVSAPLARALINKVVGDSVTVDTPKGAHSYEIISIEFS